ncbi:hypothetical protein [Uliginosibacterium aquaticum]|uniref:Uncharacterized protein n=1 Tax=Uliginosibacterium aquaticum TaxID=2731212 RepID=A0ABX2IG56_9RHOO|nr:hypothetical protein [Uliginosibacterium aquaticum]NSL55715.1 hypothetical protein [Uliginosibacterium aquaticum]
MATTLFALGFALLALFAGLYGYCCAERGWRLRAGGYGLGFLGLLCAGLWLAGRAGEEALAYGFGFALMLVLPALLVAGAAAALGAVIRRRNSRPPQL